MDPDVFPNSIEYWGPNGMVFFRNVQLAYTPCTTATPTSRSRSSGRARAPTPARTPSASSSRTSSARFPAPDVSARLPATRGTWGHVKVAGIFRYIGGTTSAPTPIDLSGHAYGWGVNLSSNIKLGADTCSSCRPSTASAIENYMNDARRRHRPRSTSTIPRTPIAGEALPVLGLVAFIDINVERLVDEHAPAGRTCDVDNTDGQTPDAFHMGHYALGNILYPPDEERVLRRRSSSGAGARTTATASPSNDYRLQFSFKYSFSHSTGGTQK